MLDESNAREVINQLSKEQFLCNNNLISTSGYIIIKKTRNITTDRVGKAIYRILEEDKNET